jgi:opacity protein-like surface antigen
MKKLLILLACTVMGSAALADDASLEVRFGDVAHSSAPSSTEYVLGVSHNLPAGLSVGGELQTRQASGAVTGIAAANLGWSTAVFGLKIKPSVELGHESVSGDSTNFWGAGVNLSYPLVSSVSVEAGYRHREGFGNSELMKEDRVHGGLAMPLTKSDVLAVGYQHYTGTLSQNVIGVSLRHAF